VTDPRAEIRHLQSIYNTAGDRGRIDDVLTVFAEDGVLDIPGRTLAGKSAIAAFLSNVARTGSDSVDLRGSRHHLSTSRIDLVGEDAALGWSYFFVMRAGQVIQEGTYIDRFARIPEGWRIAHRRVKILWTLGD
jgi:ABC-type dipeptide/oligopeptide/nickel transport system ATPase subunit